MDVTNGTKLIAVDCDGTLFDSNGMPSSQTCIAVQRTAKAGHSIVAATGRSRFTAAHRLTAMPAMRYLICSNGAYAWDTLEDKLVWKSEIAVAQVVDIVARLRNAFSDVAFSWESCDGLGFDDAFSKLAGGVAEMETGGRTAELGSEALYKLKVRRPGVLCIDLQPELVNVLGDNLCEITSSGAPFIEITALGATKASGLAQTSAMLGYTFADAIVFGDNLNDVSMFEWAGHAVAMGNGVDEVKHKADAVTLSNTQHGVAHYLETLLDAGQL